MTSPGVERAYLEIRRRGLLSRGDGVAVAFSGGPDSLCLLHLLARLAPALELNLVALHVDHGLRPEAKQEALRAKALAQQAGVPFRLLNADLAGAGGNLQERAREARAMLLGEASEGEGCGRLALGHTADDQAETVIMRAIRGAGPRGLAAMAWQDGPLVRPLLGTTRQEIEEYLTSQHLRPVRDPTNVGQAYMRNRVRQGVMPLLRQENPRVVDALCRLAEICREEDLALTTVCGEALVRAGADLDDGLDVPSLAGLPAAMLPRVLLLAHQQATGTARRLERSHVQQMVELVLRKAEGTATLDLPGVRVERRYNTLTWVPRQGREVEDPAPLSPLEIPGPGDYPLPDGGTLHLRVGEPGELIPVDGTHHLAAGAVGFPLHVRSPKPGDRLEIAPEKTCKVAKLLSDAKIPRVRRRRTPLVFYRQKLVLVVGLRAAYWCSGPSRGEAIHVWSSY